MSRVAARYGTLVPATLKTVYPKPPQASPPDAALPAGFLRYMGSVVSYSASQRQTIYTIELIALVRRSANLPDDYDAAIPLVDPMVQTWEQYTSLGAAQYFDARVTSVEVGPASFSTASDTGGDAQYVAVIATLQVKEKTAVSMS
jgi:hypothetical protein